MAIDIDDGINISGKKNSLQTEKKINLVVKPIHSSPRSESREKKNNATF